MKKESLFLEPMSTLTHLMAAVLAIPAAALLLWLSRHDLPRMWSLLVYGVSLIVLFSASSLLHGLKATPRLRDLLHRFDHAAIFLLIAGTYTPIVVNLFPADWVRPTLVVVWTVATVGIVHKVFSTDIHGFVSVSIYVVLGWGGVAPLAIGLPLGAIMPPSALYVLLFGGLIYTAGFIIYYRRRPDPWPGVFGHHEIWHLFVIAGSACHYVYMLLYVALPAGG